MNQILSKGLGRSPLVSVIVPVYNAEATLVRSFSSLLAQTLENFEVIVVDDCSQDGSKDEIRKIILSSASETVSFKLVEHPENKGVAAARNSGLEAATGKYIYYVDADDWIDPDTLSRLVEKAEATDADIVGHSWCLSFQGNERKMHQPGFTNSLEALRWMMAGVMRWNLWLFLVKRTLYDENNIRFLDGMNMGEDMMVTVKLFANASCVSFVDGAFYHYMQTNADSLTKTYSKEHIRQVTANVEEVAKYLNGSRYSDELNTYICQLKLNIKLPLLISDDKSRYQQWTEWFPEANFQIMHNKYLPLRTRLLQLTASKREFWLVWLYYRIVIKFIYGIVYK